MMKRYQGFTLLELVMVIVLFGIIAVASSQLLSQGLTAYLTGQQITDANWQGQIAMERMIRDIRDVRSANDITIFTASEFAFVDITGTSIDYKLTGSTLMRNSQVLADGVNSLTFSYFSQTGTSGPTQANIHYVKIALNITRNSTNYTLTTSAYLRDLAS